MYFYLSKTLGILAFPSNSIILIILLGVVLWRTRYGRCIALIGFLLLLAGAMTPIGAALLLPLEDRFPQWDDTRGAPDGMIVLGGIISTYISRHRNDIAIDSSAERLFAAVELERRYPDARIIFAGGNSDVMLKGLPEADFAARFLQRLGVPSDHILIDRNSRDTFENAIDAKKIASPKLGERWLLITSAFHMPRAIGIFRRVGFTVEAYPVDWKTGGPRDLAQLQISPLGNLTRLDIAVHEWLALIINRAVGRTSTLFPAPTDGGAVR